MGRLLLCLALCSIVVSASVWYPQPEDVKKFMGEDISLDKFSLPEIRQKFLARTKAWAESLLPAKHKKTEEYPYFAFVPEYINNVVPGGSSVSWAAPCFKTNVATAAVAVNGIVELKVTVSEPTSLLCSDEYLFGTISAVSYQKLFEHGDHSVQFNLTKLSDSEQWDINNQGIRIFRFLSPLSVTLSDLVTTIKLFGPETTQGVSEEAAALNIDFLTKYSGFTMTKRNTTEVPIDESLIQSGDFFGIVRLDGLDPMLAWAMGSTTGHTTIALRIDGVLYVAESTTKDSYWPTNGVQINTYATWMAQAKAADYNVVWAPLNAEARAKFNATAAYEWFQTVKGIDYGYQTLLWGWIDTLTDNYPCLPPSYETCLTWSHVEVLFGTVSKLIPSLGDLLFNEAFNLRLGTTGLTAPDLFKTADLNGLGGGKLPVVVERDDWVYHTTRDGVAATGPSQVCCVFVCNMWKAGGLFADINNELNCAELTNWDDYALNLFDPNTSTNRPAECKAADPDNELCQTTGKYTLTLNNFNYKKMYPHMAENCPSLAPDYKRADDC